ncbi:MULTISPECIES: signal peptidase II [unclassified Streptomyces]|uniref:signal peptidase II n=1 Tax=unclassified Streptomyces TaxID=2593676 RepID=UPI002F918BAA|nr:signal peptidase II [Streptomyces sp. NBC_01108]
MLAAVVLLADQLTKLWAVSALSDSERVAVIPPLIHFRLLYNAGAAFSIGTEATWVFTLAAAAAVVGILYTARRLASASWALVLGARAGRAARRCGIPPGRPTLPRARLGPRACCGLHRLRRVRG